MMNKQVVLDEIDREIQSVRKRRWVNRHWPRQAQSDPKQKIIDDLLKQRSVIEKKDPNFFDKFDDIHDALDSIENEIYGENL